MRMIPNNASIALLIVLMFGIAPIVPTASAEGALYDEPIFKSESGQGRIG